MPNSAISQYLPILSITFDKEVEGTYVVSVTIESTNFSVNCQTGITLNYKESSSLTCNNNSGSDYYESGLFDFIEAHYNSHTSTIHTLLPGMIEECAQKEMPINTVYDYISDREEFQIVSDSEDLFGACYHYNCYMTRYNEEDGERVVVVAIDTDEPLIKNAVKKYRVFDNVTDYKQWRDKQYQGDDTRRNLYHGDFLLAARAFDDL